MKAGQWGVPGWILFKNGTRYYADATGNITKIIDKNGNTVAIATDSSTYLTVTDSLGRQITVQYADLSGKTTPPVFDTIQYPGADGTPHKITVTYDLMAN